MTTEFELGEPVWVTRPDGMTLAVPCAYGPFMLEMYKGCTFSREQPPINWQTMVAEWMIQGYGPVEAIKLRNHLIKFQVPCNKDTIAAIHSTMVARWHGEQIEL